ncbi:MAG: choice-of-anchor J domain-containing protein, partial [Candidatus Cloacimonetes bacterium]|nr:choice-of-anchor J domain-containing protein [Candidatus Cloacimonadota bacterium]MDY0172533.1 choice-of-anchor J domain-containing protein [Candidatus Cloacimonadaceae bacterium]
MKKFLLLIGILALALGLFADVIIGTGTETQRQPFGAYFGYERSAAIYTASEINATGTITHLGWYVDTVQSTSIPVKIYLTTTTDASLTANTWANMIAGATQVYEATTQFNATGWAHLDITDFAYNHQNGRNLLVLCEANFGGTGSSPYPKFRYSTAGNRHQHWNTDTNPPLEGGSVNADRPNITLSGITKAPSIVTFPTTYNFGTLSTDAFPPLNWTKHDGVLANPTVLGAAGTGKWVQGNWKNDNSTPNKAARMNIYGSSAVGWLISPPINIPAAGYELMFDVAYMAYYNNNPPAMTGTDDKFAVLIGNGTSWTPANVARMWDNAGSPYVLNNIPPAGMPVTLPFGAAGTYRVAFYGISTVSNADNDLMVDNITFRQTPSTPIFALSPNVSSWNFGSTMINTAATKQFTITNTGGGTINLSSVVCSSTYYSISVAPTDLALTAGESTNFTVQYLPTAAGTNHPGTLAINASTGGQTMNLVGSCYDPIIASFPWSENFGTESSHWPVEYWTNYEGYYPTTLYETARWGRGNWLNGPSGNNAAKISIYGSNFASWLITPPINIPATGYELRFDLGLTNYSTTTAAIAGAQPDDRFIVAISNSPDMSNPTILREWNNTGSPYVFDAIPNTGIKTVINLGAYTGIKYIAFYADTSVDNGWNDLFVDNVNVRITPTAPSITLWPTPLYFNGTAINTQSEYRNIGIANTGNGTINLSVADFSLIGADAGHFEYISSALPAAIAADQSINIPVRFVPSSVGEKSAILRIRYAGIDYNMELKGTAVSETALLEGFEGGVIPSNWTVHNVDGGNKLWDAMTLNPRTGTYAARARNEGPGWTNNDWLITPALQVRSTTTDKISFWMRTESASTDNVWQVLISTTDTNPSSFTMIDQGMGIMPEYVQKTYHLDSYGDAVIYLAVRYIGNQAYALLVDDFVGPELYVAPVPPLAATLVSPADGATDITLDTTLNWASGGGQVDGYKLSLWEDLSTHAVEIVTDLDL